MFATVLLMLIVVVARACVCWPAATHLSPTDGVWLALMKDLKHGVFYRPLLGPLGYGGTRYFPLFFVLYALLIKSGIPILVSGYLLSAIGVALLLVGTFFLMRNVGVELWLACSLAGAVLGSGAVQLSFLGIHDDGLASGLNICALALIANPRRTHLKILLASALFTLAWSTKVTTVFGIAAALSWLLLGGFLKEAWELAAETALGYLAVAIAMVLASQGRVIGIFKACASAGTTLAKAAVAPFHMLSVAARDDPGLFLFLFLALCVLPVRSWRSLPVLLFGWVALVTSVVFASPGTSYNHLVDLQAAAVILFGSWLAEKLSQTLKKGGVFALGLAMLFSLIPAVHNFETNDRALPGDRFQKAIKFIGDTRKPILAENPAFPVLAGQSAYALDPFMLRVLRERFPSLRDPLLQELRNQSFSAVVLSMRDPRTDAGRTWYEKDIFGTGFLGTLNEHYQLRSVIGDQFIYVPNAK